MSAEPPPAGTSGANGTTGSAASTTLLPTRPMLMAGGLAALAAAACGLAVLVMLALIGWITAPHVGLGGGLAGALRSAGVLWLVAHHVEVTVQGVGKIGLLPLGLVLLPAALIERAGRWMTREGYVTRLKHVGQAALSIALPYALFSGAVAVGSSTSQAAPSLWQAIVVGFGIALLASGFGAARGLASWRSLAGRVPPRPRSVILGAIAALALLAACGGVLDAASLAIHLNSYKQAVDALNPGIVGSALLLLAGLAYLPNAIIWAITYLLGPGFAFGVGTAVSASGSALGAVPAFPMLAALPVGTKAAFPAWLGFFILLMPYLAGALAGVMTVRIAPTPWLEAAPLWGLVTGLCTALVIGLSAKVSGGPLGAGRLSSVGPSGAEAGVVAALEVGVTAAIVAGVANWLIIRHHVARIRAASAAAGTDASADDRENIRPAGPLARATGPLARAAASPQSRASRPRPALIVDESDDDGGHRIHVNPWAEDAEE